MLPCERLYPLAIREAEKRHRPRVAESPSPGSSSEDRTGRRAPRAKPSQTSVLAVREGRPANGRGRPWLPPGTVRPSAAVVLPRGKLLKSYLDAPFRVGEAIFRHRARIAGLDPPSLQLIAQRL